MPRRSKTKISQAALEQRAAERRRQDFERVGLQPEAANLASNDDVVVERAKRADTTKKERGNVERAHRGDVFDRLNARGALSDPAYASARRLDDDLTERRGEGGRQLYGDGGSGFGSRDLVTARSLDAGRRVDAVLRLIGRRDAALLVELLEPRRVLCTATVSVIDGVEVRDQPDRWRLVVALICGEKRSEVQAGAIRSAAENLTLAYRDIDGATRRAS